MRYNLENRPKPIDDRPTIEELKYVEWFEGFEKELREILRVMKENQKVVDGQYYDGRTMTVREILGDDNH